MRIHVIYIFIAERDLNQVCSDKSQCKDNNAACINNHCECKMGYRQSEETYCVTGKFLFKYNVEASCLLVQRMPFFLNTSYQMDRICIS